MGVRVAAADFGGRQLCWLCVPVNGVAPLMRVDGRCFSPVGATAASTNSLPLRSEASRSVTPSLRKVSCANLESVRNRSEASRSARSPGKSSRFS